MNPVRLESRIAQDEGFRSRPYRDTLGFWTYGYGFRRDMFGHEVHERTPAISEATASRMLRGEIYQAWSDAWAVVPLFAALDPVRQEVLVNMAYNLGSAKLRRFKKMLAALADRDFGRAADEMQDSRWFTQVHNRAARLVSAMQTGVWPK